MLLNRFGIIPASLVRDGQYELLADIEVASATSRVDITGLNIDAADELVLVSDVVNPKTGGAHIQLCVNNNVTVTNYYAQRIEAGGTSVNGFRVNRPTLFQASASARSCGQSRIRLIASGHITALSAALYAYTVPTNLYTQDWAMASTFTASSITQLNILSDEVGAIGIGSRFQLYKVVSG